MSVRHALLALLSEGPKIGLKLRDEFEQRTGDVWPLNVGQVYTTLQRLERDGLIVTNGDDDGPQKDYRITDEGRLEVDAWLHTPPSVIPPRDELVIKVLVALGRARRRRARRAPIASAQARRVDAGVHQRSRKRRSMT